MAEESPLDDGNKKSPQLGASDLTRHSQTFGMLLFFLHYLNLVNSLSLLMEITQRSRHLKQDYVSTS
jgi:hypothetical protein